MSLMLPLVSPVFLMKNAAKSKKIRKMVLQMRKNA